MYDNVAITEAMAPRPIYLARPLATEERRPTNRIVQLQDERASRRGHSWDLQAALVELRDQRLLKIPAIVEGQPVPVDTVLAQIAPLLIR